MDEELFITLSDLKLIYAKVKHHLKSIFLITFVLTAVLLLIQPPQYSARATFRQAPQRLDEGAELKSFFKNSFLDLQEASALPLFLSDNLLKETISELGMQVTVTQGSRIWNGCRRVCRNIGLECGASLSDPDGFAFSHVTYNGEKTQTFSLQFQTPETFLILDKKHTIIAEATLHKPVVLTDMSFIVTKTPKNLRLKKGYPLSIVPAFAAVAQVRKNFQARASKRDKNILELAFRNKDRHVAAQFLNAHMASYQRFLRIENRELSQAQLAYLEKRQEELTGKLDQSLKEHMAYLKQNLDENGFIGLHQEIEMLSAPREEYLSKLFEIDLDLKRLDAVHTSRRQSQTARIPYDEKRKELQAQLASFDLDQKRMEYASSLQKPLDEIKHLSYQIEEAENLLKILDGGGEQTLHASLTSEAMTNARRLLQQISEMQAILSQAAEQEGKKLQAQLEISKNQLKIHLEDSLTHLRAKQRALQENILIRTSIPAELQGINLETAQRLYLEYNQQQDGIQANLRQLIYLRDQIDDPNFELSSLTTILSDPVSQEMVRKASEMALQLRDEHNRSVREQERLREALTTQKKFIFHHITQTIELTKLRAKLIDEKIAALQETCIDLLKNEKALVEGKLSEITEKMSNMPEKWRLENQLAFRKQLGMSMIEGLTELAESKSIHHHLFQVASKPLDSALAPVFPQKPRLILYSLASSAFMAAAAFLFFLLRSVVTGLPATPERLAHSGFGSVGRLSQFADVPTSELRPSDLSTLRKLASLITQGCFTLIEGKLLSYAANLAHLLTLQGKRVLVIKCHFDTLVTPQDQSGLLSYLEGDVPSAPIRREKGYDVLPFGGPARYVPEKLATPSYRSLLQNLKSQYNIILLTTTSRPADPDALIYLKEADGAIISVYQEKIEELIDYRLWQDQKNGATLAFVNF